MASYGSFLVFAVILVIMPGPDFAVVTKNTLAAGRRRGAWSAVGVATSNAVQGVAAATGLGAVIVRAQPVFEAVKWAGVAYLAFLGVQAIRAAVRGTYPEPKEGEGASGGWRQGFLSNITNPKVLVFYLAVLPQFLDGDAGLPALLAYALSHAALSLCYLLTLTVLMSRVRHVLTRPRVRRGLDAATGTALLGFSARLAAEH
ncbi:LysE family translocator [Actinomadura sp. DC4]|uniref:LysE family translocator n=1 Tax=Actinomadura sp. DC4 TaxID=3055069 RepID=UPI0025B0C9AE|nr:LysE family translocator [Actinomadura sp. DC4]MDN3353087.1 LysE family translocator [Actinomadura sp. DC4]